MSEAGADPIAAVVAILRADTAVAAVAGTAVFGGELPRDAVATMPSPAIVVTPAGGTSLTGASFAQVDAQRIDVTAVGATPAAANALIRLAATALREVRRRVAAGTLIHWVNSAGGFLSARDNEGQWPMASQSFQIFHSLEEID